ncbi:MAG: amidohydrolase family protein [Acidimicrobiales bacterium]
MMKLPETDHHIVISADSHCGAALRDYKPYLEQNYHRAFDEWADHIEADAKRTDEMFEGKGRSTRNVGIDGDPVLDADKNFSTERRLRDQSEDGVIATVLFPNTQPPFAPPPATQFEAPPYSDDIEHRWAGLRAHNRWLLDFVGEAPERRAGIAQIFLGDVEGSVNEIEWAAENGLRGGILVPGAPPDSPFDPLYSAIYEPIWAAAQAHDMPLNHHAGGASPSFGNHFPASLAMFMLEVTWWSQRALWHLMFSGVFERFPDVKWINTETGTAWVPETLDRLDNFYYRMKYSTHGSESIFGGMAVAAMSLKPSEYWQRQCYVGASFLRPTEAPLCRDVGIDNIMWGSDYPHIEGSHPFTKDHLRLTFADLPIDETIKLLTSNVARVYKFDLEALLPLAEQHCLTKAEVATPISYDDIAEEAKGCPGMNPLNQVQAV